MKRKKFLSFLLSAVLVLSMFPITAFAADDPEIWNGTADTSWYDNNPTAQEYTLTTAEELAGLAELVNNKTHDFTNKTIKLGADIVLNDTSNLQNWGTTPPANTWTPIGSYYQDPSCSPFHGTFDGQGHIISGIYFNGTDPMDLNNYSIGFFGGLSGAEIKNLGIKDSRIQGYRYVGALAGYAVSETYISNCWSESDVFGSSDVGGLVGVLGSYDFESFIYYCYNSGTVNGPDAGGIVGRLVENNVINGCFNTGAVTGGGIVGDCDQQDIINSYYMEGSASNGAGPATDGVYSMTEAEFKNGKLAYYLNGDQEILGHTTLNGTEFPQFPVFNSNVEYVVEVSFYYEENNLYDTRYVFEDNSLSGSGAALPPEPTYGAFIFEGWNTAMDGSGTDFTATTTVTEDISVYARWNKFAGGDGSQDSPYLIETSEQLCFMAEAVNSDNSLFGDKHYKLNADIDLGAEWTINEDTFEAELTEGNEWVPIGNEDNPFSGDFDGNGHTVSGFYINNSDYNQGLFGHVEEGTIKNLTVEDSYICGDSQVGAIVGYLYDGSISNCRSSATVEGENLIGGICGYVNHGTVSACTNTGTVIGSAMVGGIAGLLEESTISELINSGVVAGDSDSSGDIGGIAGTLNNSQVYNCYNTGAVSGDEAIGGIAGTLNNSQVYNCYNTGAISGNDKIGGITGEMLAWSADFSSEVTNSFSTGLITGNSVIGGIAGYVGEHCDVSNSYYLDLEGSAEDGIGEGFGTAAEKDEEAFKNGEVAHLLQGTEQTLTWGHSVLDGSELPRLAALASGVEKVIRIRFYDDISEPGTFELNSAVYTLMGGKAVFPTLEDVAWDDDEGDTYTEDSTFNADTDLYMRRVSAKLDPVSAGFDRNPANQADVTTTITWNSASSVTDVKNSGESIGSDNYSVSDTTLTIKKEYLVSQAMGNLSLTIEFDVGNAAVLTINITDTTPPGISPLLHNYDLNEPDDITATITWNSAVSVTDFVYRVNTGISDTLDSSSYNISDDTLKIDKSFFSALSLTEGNVVEFDISFNTGTVLTLTVNVVDSYIPSGDANLSSLSVNGTPVSGFDPDITEYNVVLPHDAAGAIVTAEASDPKAQVSITQALSLPGSATVSVTAENGNSKEYTINFTMTDPPVATYTVIFMSEGEVYDTRIVNDGQSIGSADWPANPTRGGYTFRGWYTGENGTGTRFTAATPVNASITVYAKWSERGGNGSDGGGEQSGGSGENGSDGGKEQYPDSGGNEPGGSEFPSDGESTTPSTTDYYANVSTGSGLSLTLPVTVDKSSGTAYVDISPENSQIIEGETIVISLPEDTGINTYTLGIPVQSLSALDGQGTITVVTGVGTVTIPSNMLTDAAGSGGSRVEITIGQGNKEELPDDVRAAVGDRPLISLRMSIDGKQTDWNNPDTPVTVSIPYTPTAEELENPESIVVWYIDGSGNVVSVPNGRYDPATGTVTFTTTHFSYYAVSYRQVSFNDVVKDAWYSKAVSFIAAREITYGTGGGNFSPDAKLTRGEFIVMLMRAYGIAPDENPADNFSDAGSTYYTGYVAAAKRLGISNGVGNNMFAPGKEITRQEMFTLLYNALNIMGCLPEGTADKDITAFSDSGSIASWAKDAITHLVKAGIVTGSNGKLSPTATASRAEMAQVLYNLLMK